MITKIISGGQTGADRGALEAAIYAHVSHGGWCPSGRLTEDGLIPLKYDIQQTGSEAHLQSTEWNVRDSDCTLVFTHGALSADLRHTVDTANLMGKSVHIADLRSSDSKMVVGHICGWLLGQIEEEEFPPPPRHPVLNVAGPRESKVHGIEDKVASIIVQVLIRMNPECGNLYPLICPKN